MVTNSLVISGATQQNTAKQHNTAQGKARQGNVARPVSEQSRNGEESEIGASTNVDGIERKRGLMIGPDWLSG